MIWIVCLLLSVSAVIFSIIFSVFQIKLGGKVPNPTNVLLAGVSSAIVILSIPLFMYYCKNNGGNVLEAFLLSIHNMLAFYVVGTNLDAMLPNMVSASSGIYAAYSILFSFLLVAAPVLTFGFVLSFFKNVSARQKLMLHYGDDIYIFSALNGKSVSLAKSLLQKKKRAIVFACVQDELDADLIQQANEMNAICFSGDILSINLKLHSKRSHFHFFAIGDDPSGNLSLGLKVITQYGNWPNSNLYIFSDAPEAELHLLNFNKKDDNTKPYLMKVRCISEAHSLVFRTLYDQGYEIFQTAKASSTDLKHISAVLIGMSAYGFELLKALPWFCQMDGYTVSVDVFDASNDVQSIFSDMCPELLDSRFNRIEPLEGEATCKISFHSGISYNSNAFSNSIRDIKNATYVWVSLDDDESTVSAAIKLRMLFAQIGCYPVIKAVIKSTDKKTALFNASNFKGQKYNIDCIGDIESTYSEDVILSSSIEQKALARHLMWGEEDQFWRYRYNYRSSIASIIHSKMKIACGIAGAELPAASRTEEQLWAIRKLEHKRWNAYMRSEGYTYAPIRNDLAKQHYCLVPFDELSLHDQEKDDA